jgi:PEP-CTERM motif-containing protein
VTAGTGNGIIEEFSSNGVGSVFATGLSYPTGLAFDSSGNLFAGEEGNGTIEEYSTNAVGTVFASGLTGDPWGLAFQPVPEPSTCAMVAMGVGVVLTGLRLRRPS